MGKNRSIQISEFTNITEFSQIEVFKWLKQNIPAD